MTAMQPNTAVLFPGQGSHSEGMEEPFRQHPLLQRGIELLGFDPFDRLSEGTRTHQPALLLCSIAQWASRDEHEEDPVAAAGAIHFEDALRLVDARARAMADAAEREDGGMVAMLKGERDDILELAAELGLSLANDNSPGQIVLSGRSDAIAQAVERAGDIGCRARRLDVGGAFHSPLMAPAADALREALDATEIREPDFPVLSNGSTRPFADIRTELAENLLKPVRWRETLLELQSMGATDFVECGPGSVLTGLVKRTLKAPA